MEPNDLRNFYLGKVRNPMKNLFLSVPSQDEKENFSKLILESIKQGIITFNINGIITSANCSALSMLDLGSAEIIGKPYSQVFLENNPLHSVIKESLLTKRPYDDIDIKYPFRGKKTYLRTSTFINHNWEKEVIGIILLVKDASNLRKAEKGKIRNERLVAVGRLTGSIAHEIRNPLSAMKINLQLLEEHLGPVINSSGQEKPLKYLKTIHSEIKRLDSILQNFIRFSRPPSIESKPVDLHALLDNVLSLFSPEAKQQGIEMEKSFLATDSLIYGDYNQLEQVCMNIIINSFQAMPAGGKIQVKTEDESLKGATNIEFMDTGEGIAQENLDKIFDLYFTTKPEGSGFGLSIALRIIKDHGGTIDVESKKGEGAKFVIKIPRNTNNHY